MGSHRVGGIVVLLGSIMLTANPVPAQDRDRMTAERVVKTLTSIPYGTARREWRGLATNATWRDQRGPRAYPPASVRPQPKGLWCSIATDAVGGERRDAIFYALRTERPYDCRLESVSYVFEESSATRGLYEALATAIKTRFTIEVPVTPSRIAVGPEFPGRADVGGTTWEQARVLRSTAVEVVLVRSGSMVQVIAQSDILGHALESEYDGSLEERRYGVDLLTWELVNALRPTDPEIGDLLLDTSALEDQAIAESAVGRVLRARATAKGDRRVMLSLAAARMVGLLRYEGDSWQRDRPAVAALRKYGVRMNESPYDGGIWYGVVDFEDEILRRRPGTRWGQLVFVERLSRGWADSDGHQYRDVIAQGTAWLKRYPGSPLAVTVRSHVARAYETWWSLSLAPDDEEFVTASEHAKGAAEARRQAIRWYQGILRDAPTSLEAQHARRVLIQIIVGVDTGERAFFSVYA